MEQERKKELSEETLKRDNSIAQAALRRIAHANPALLPKGPHNKDFGKAIPATLERLQNDAAKALVRMEGTYEQDSKS